MRFAKLMRPAACMVSVALLTIFAMGACDLGFETEESWITDVDGFGFGTGVVLADVSCINRLHTNTASYTSLLAGNNWTCAVDYYEDATCPCDPFLVSGSDNAETSGYDTSAGASSTGTYTCSYCDCEEE